MSSDDGKHKQYMKRLHESLPVDSIRRIFSDVRSGVMTDDVAHDRGIFLSQMDHDPTAANQLKEIDSAWVDSLKEQDQTECKEYKQFKRKLELANTPKSELNKRLLKKELKIVMKTVKKLKLFMNKYKDDPDLVEKIKDKLNLIIGDSFWHSKYYSRGGLLGSHEGAHPEYIMNSFIYNPQKDETRFKVLQIDGVQVTYQPYRNNEPVGEPVKIGLDEFLKKGLSVEFMRSGVSFSEDVPIGEEYKIFPKRDYVDETVESHNAKVDDYLEHLMRTFTKKPAGFFSAPYVPPAKAKRTSGGGRTHRKRDSNKNKRTHKHRK